MINGKDYTVHDLVRDELYKNMDPEYGLFQAKLNPGVGNIIGVRMPVLRSMAKEIASVNWKEYLDGAVDDTFEEVMLQGLVLGYAKGNIEDILQYVERFIPKIDNWAVCDSFCSTFKIAKKRQQEVWDFLVGYIRKGATEFELRVVMVMMMDYYLNDNYIDKVLYTYNTVKHDAYYVKMAIAWGLATAYAKYPGKTMLLMQDNDIDDETYNMAIRKMIESYRVSDEAKTVLRTMKR